MQNLLHSVGEALTPILKESNFLETGRLTPDEFVAAGDYLVYKCPTWSWSAGDPSKLRSFLPKDKQFLITKAVPCALRVKQMHIVKEQAIPGLNDWVETVPSEEGLDYIDIQNTVDDVKIEQRPSSPSIQSDSEIPDMETFEDEDNVIRFADPEQYIPAISSSRSEDNLVRSRTYDLSITYDKYYQTPRLWLCGYDEDGSPLEPGQVFEDISQEHAKKTVTIEAHPHMVDCYLASIHPCKHAHVMRSIVSFMERSSTSSSIRVDRYLVLFLKFMGCVLPTIQYDHTMSV